MSLSSSLLTEIDLLDDLDEEQEAEKDMLLACVLVGEYLSENRKGQHFIKKQNGVGKHITELMQKELRNFRICA